MITLSSLFPYPSVEPLMAELLAGGPGLIIVAGYDPPPEAPGKFLPSGRAAVFRTLFDALFTQRPDVRCILVASDHEFLRPPRGTAKRFTLGSVEAPLTYAQRMRDAILHRPGLLALDRLDAETTPLALEAGRNGLRVLAPLETVLYGGSLARGLLDLGASPDQLSGLAWSLAVQRVPGGAGDHAILDIFRADAPASALATHPSRLSFKTCLQELAQRGQIAPQAALSFESDLLRRTFSLLAVKETLLRQATQRLEMKNTELEAANRVLRHRTEAIFSLEELSQAVTGSDDLHSLGQKICQRAGNLCGAERAVLYFHQAASNQAAVLAVTGWDASAFPALLAPLQVFGAHPSLRPIAYNRCPPGFPPSKEEQKAIRAGLWLPLIAQERLVGADDCPFGAQTPVYARRSGLNADLCQPGGGGFAARRPGGSTSTQDRSVGAGAGRTGQERAPGA